MSKYEFSINNKKYSVQIKAIYENEAQIDVNGEEVIVNIETNKKNEQPKSVIQTVSVPTIKKINTGSNIVAPIPGLIIKILVNAGDIVKVGQPVIIMEAMKMQNEIQATKDGKIKNINVKIGDNVLEGTLLVSYE